MAAVLEAYGDDSRSPSPSCGRSSTTTLKRSSRPLGPGSVRFLAAEGGRQSAASHQETLWAEGEAGLRKEIDAYLRSSSDTSWLDGELDIEAFLAWRAGATLTDEETDAETVDPLSVEYLGLKQLLTHRRFQHRLRGQQSRIASLSTQSRDRVLLNPIHVWATLESDPARSRDATTTEVLFYPQGEEIKSVILGEDAAELLRRIEYHGSPRVRDLVRGCDELQEEEALRVLLRLCELGIAALA